MQLIRSIQCRKGKINWRETVTSAEIRTQQKSEEKCPLDFVETIQKNYEEKAQSLDLQYKRLQHESRIKKMGRCLVSLISVEVSGRSPVLPVVAYPRQPPPEFGRPISTKIVSGPEPKKVGGLRVDQAETPGNCLKKG